MRLSTKSRYAVTSLLDMVLHSGQGPVSLTDIAVRQDISLSYLEQIFAKMRRNKLVVSRRGPGGGYHLSGSPENVCIADVIKAVEGVMDVSDNHLKTIAGSHEPCLTEQLWEELSEQIHDFLSNISIADMIRDEEVRALSRQHDSRQSQDELL